MSKPILGIVLGTKFSSAGYLSGENPVIISDAYCSKLIPSIVCYTDEYPMVGNEAAQMMDRYPYITIYDTEKIFGRKFTDPVIEKLSKELPFHITCDPKTDEILIQLPINENGEPKTIHPYEVISEILKYLVELANETLPPEDRGNDCILIVPANWGELPREEIRKASQLANLNVKLIVNEPTSAAVAYINQIRGSPVCSKQANIIFDFGAENLDVSLIEIEGLKFDIKAISNKLLGGKDLEQCLIDWTIEKNKFTDLNPREINKIKKECNNAIQSLSRSSSFMMNLENICKKDINMNITRNDFEKICKPLFDQIIDPIKNVLEKAEMNKNQIDDVIMIGSSSFIPKVIQILNEFFGKNPIRFPDPELAVVIGATIIASEYLNKIQEEYSSSIEFIGNLNETTTSNKLKILSTETIEKLLQKKKLIGQGGQSKVYKVLDQNKYLVLKEINIQLCQKEDDNDEISGGENDDELQIDIDKIRRFYFEYELLYQFNHPNIIKTFGFYFGDKCHAPCILLEYCNTSLDKEMNNLNNIQLVGVIYEISRVMDYVHKAGIIHRDLKPSNILLDSEKHVKLCDFGTAALINTETQATISRTEGIGTIRFMAPEILQGNCNYDEKVDVFSFGVVVFYLLTKGNYPNITEILGKKKLTFPNCINKNSKDLILQCLSLSSKDRPSFEKIVEFINLKNFRLIEGIEKEIGSLHEYLKLSSK